jgi:hypothetical protein
MENSIFFEIKNFGGKVSEDNLARMFKLRCAMEESSNKVKPFYGQRADLSLSAPLPPR